MSRNLFFPACLSFCLLGLGVGFAQNVETTTTANDTLKTSMVSSAPAGGNLSSDNVRVLPPSLIAQADGGQVEHGIAKSTVLQRFSAWYTDDILINDRLEVRGGVGGLFYYAYPTGNPGEQAGYKNAQDFGPGISEADAIYRFGNLDHSPAFLQMGYFSYKYNPDAMDLGEYLMRSEAYPNVIVSGDAGGWNFLSEANYIMIGLRLNVSLWDGKFRSDFLLPMERDYPPTGDLSPSYVATVDPIPGIEVGAGVDCAHCIAFAPSKTTPHILPGEDNSSPGNAWVKANPAYTPGGNEPAYIPDTLANGKPAGYYTFEGVKLEARASFDPKAYIPLPMLGKQDLKIFAEMAVLGVKDYPYYYNDIYQRMPFMFGINAPAFKVLDILSFQMEYYNSKFLNSTSNVISYPEALPVPVLGTTSRQAEAQKWHWAVYAKKQVIKGITLYGQVACDHLRLPSYDQHFTFQEVTDGNGSDWYYLMRLEIGI